MTQKIWPWPFLYYKWEKEHQPQEIVVEALLVIESGSWADWPKTRLIRAEN